MSLTAIDTALDQIFAQLPKITETESLPLAQAKGRVLAEDCVSAIDVPGHDNSAMDGYALSAADLETSSSLKIVQRIAAGEVGGQLNRVRQRVSSPGLRFPPEQTL